MWTWHFILNNGKIRAQHEEHYIEKNIFASSYVLKWSSSFTEVNKTEKAVLYFDRITLLRICCCGQGESNAFLFQKAKKQQPEGHSGTRAEGKSTEQHSLAQMKLFTLLAGTSGTGSQGTTLASWWGESPPHNPHSSCRTRHSTLAFTKPSYTQYF